jgi:hypothetical protein
MIRIPKVTMTMRELDRLKCIQGLIDGHLKQHAVAARLGLTTRQVRRLVRRYEQQGPVGLISTLRDRPSNRRLKPEVAEHAFGIPKSEHVAARSSLIGGARFHSDQFISRRNTL